MIYILKILIFIGLYVVIYLLIMINMEKKTLNNVKEKISYMNKLYIERLMYQKENKALFKYNEKNIFDKLYVLLIKTGIIENKKLWWIIPQTILLLCLILFLISYIIFIPILKLEFLTITFCLPISFAPIFILMVLSEIYEEKLEKNLISYIIQLKNQVKINNDIITSFRETTKYALKPLNIYIDIFLFEVNNGINVSIAFENLKNRVNIQRFKQLIINLDSCYINGGDFYYLLDKTQNIFLKVQEERNKRDEQTMSARIVLILLLGMSVFVYFNFINSNVDNYNIMINDFVGRLILYWNFISIWLMIFLIIFIKKVDSK